MEKDIVNGTADALIHAQRLKRKQIQIRKIILKINFIIGTLQ